MPESVIFYLNFNLNEMSELNGKEVPEHYIRFSAHVKKVFEAQRSDQLKGISFPKIDPGAVDRRALALSLFGIMSSEAARVGSADVFASFFPKLMIHYPKPGIIVRNQGKCENYL